MLLVAMTTTTFYLITVYTPTFGKTVLHIERPRTPDRHPAGAVTNFIWLPSAVRCRTASGASPCCWRHGAGDPDGLSRHALARRRHRASAACSDVLLWFSFLFGMYNGAMSSH
jgi:MHS family citrate/tricarballylate:H+ symporter-like MFS transporter